MIVKEKKWRSIQKSVCLLDSLIPQCPRVVDDIEVLLEYAQELRAIQKEVVCDGCGKVTACRDDEDYREKMADHILSCEKHPIQPLLLRIELLEAGIKQIRDSHSQPKRHRQGCTVKLCQALLGE